MELAGVARDVGRAFDAALARAGGSRPMWLVLLSLKSQPTANQRELAAAVGIQDATLTHHLNGMEADGLLTRRRDPANRRVHLVELTEAGDAAFRRLRTVAQHYDTRLRTGFSDSELETLRGLLGKLRDNVTPA
jgi:MarR family transcriptional regulator for hemolysin